jgi:hypothetical protein
LFAFCAAQLDPGEKKKKKTINCVHDFVKFVEDNPDILMRIVTDDKSWCFQYDPEKKRKSMEWWRSARASSSKKIRLQKSRVRTMLIVFFDIRGTIHKEFVPQGTTVNRHCDLGACNVCTSACVE